MPRLPDPIEVSERVRIPAAEIRLAYARSGGPGGQHVNKTSSKVQLFWNLRDSPALSDEDRAWLEQKLESRISSEGELIISAESSRSQSKNVDIAVEKLVALLRESLARPKKRRKTRPSKASKERRITDKKRRGETKRLRRDPGE